MDNTIIAVYCMSWSLVIPIALFNKYMFSVMTEQPFVMLEIYWLDLGVFIFYCFLLDKHIYFATTENSGQGLGTADYLMYAENFNKDIL